MNKDLLLIGIPEGIEAGDLDILLEAAKTLRPGVDDSLRRDIVRLIDAIEAYSTGEAEFSERVLFVWIMVRVRARRMGVGLVVM